MGGGYIYSIPKRRVLKTWLNYAIGVCIYLLLSGFTGGRIVLEDIPLYFICQKSLGFPTWYIFVIILCYLSTYIAASLFRSSRLVFVLTHTLIIVAISFVLYLIKEDWWYDTIYCYAFGLVYSQYKREFEKIIKGRWLLSFIITTGLFVVLYLITQNTNIPWLISFNLLAICFAMLFVIASMKVKVGNKVINWCGAHLFPIYMYQGLFYQMLFNIGGDSHSFASWSPFVYTMSSVLLTILFATFYHKWDIKLDK